jgi:hypothetical protein
MSDNAALIKALDPKKEDIIRYKLLARALQEGDTTDVSGRPPRPERLEPVTSRAARTLPKDLLRKLRSEFLRGCVCACVLCAICCFNIRLSVRMPSRISDLQAAVAAPEVC